jgi:hypothetical protein
MARKYPQFNKWKPKEALFNKGNDQSQNSGYDGTIFEWVPLFGEDVDFEGIFLEEEAKKYKGQFPSVRMDDPIIQIEYKVKCNYDDMCNLLKGPKSFQITKSELKIFERLSGTKLWILASNGDSTDFEHQWHELGDARVDAYTLDGKKVYTSLAHNIKVHDFVGAFIFEPGRFDFLTEEDEVF